MKINGNQLKALLDLGAFERGPVEFESLNVSVPGALLATYSPADEAEANRGPVTVILLRDGRAMPLSTQGGAL